MIKTAYIKCSFKIKLWIKTIAFILINLSNKYFILLLINLGALQKYSYLRIWL